MNPVDALIIIADQLPPRQAVTLIQWYIAPPVLMEDAGPVMKHPSFKWYVIKHAREVVAMLADEYRSAHQ